MYNVCIGRVHVRIGRVHLCTVPVHTLYIHPCTCNSGSSEAAQHEYNRMFQKGCLIHVLESYCTCLTVHVHVFVYRVSTKGHNAFK